MHRRGLGRFAAASQGHEVEYFCQSDPDLPQEELTDGVTIHRAGKGFGPAFRAWTHYRANRQRYDLVYEDPIGSGRTPYFSPLYSKAPVIAVWHQVADKLLGTSSAPVSSAYPS